MSKPGIKTLSLQTAADKLRKTKNHLKRIFLKSDTRMTRRGKYGTMCKEAATVGYLQKLTIKITETYLSGGVGSNPSLVYTEDVNGTMQNMNL